jgi:hypothetical protein
MVRQFAKHLRNAAAVKFRTFAKRPKTKRKPRRSGVKAVVAAKETSVGVRNATNRELS